MVKKIIHILSFSPTHDKWIERFENKKVNTDYYRNNMGEVDYLDVDEKIERVFFYHREFHSILAMETLKHTDEFEIEFWRPYFGINKIYEKKVEGVIHKIFPAKRIKPLKGVPSYVISESMRSELKKEIENKNVLLSLGWPAKTTNELLMAIKPTNVPVLVNHRSGKLLHFHYPNSLKRFNPVVQYEKWRQKNCCNRYIDLFQCTIHSMRKYIKQRKLAETINLFDGIDFDKFQPAINKDIIKEELGIPLDKKILLYVGRFYKDKDADILIKFFINYKKQRDDIELYMVGGYITDEFYQMGLAAGAKMIERIPEKKLIKYHQIADLYIILVRKHLADFGGIGSAIIQSFACNVPVIGDNLIHFEGGVDEIKKVGRLLINNKELTNNINYILDHPQDFKDCREIARKYYDVNRCTQKLIIIYKELIKLYYEE